MSSISLMPYPRRGANAYLEGLYGALGRHGIFVHEDAQFFRSALRGQRPDFVHYHWPENFYAHHLPFRQVDRAAWFFSRLSTQRALGARVLFTFHNQNCHEAAWPWLHRWARQRMVSMSDVILVNFESAREELRRAYGRTGDVWHVRHGSYRGLYPDTISRSEARRALALPEPALVFLLFGDLRRYKNVDLAIEAFCRVEGENCRLLIVGQPRRSEEGTRLVSMAKRDRRIILHARRVADAEIQTYLRAADLLLVPREAFSSGTAVLAFDFGLPIMAPRKHHIAELARGEACFDLSDLSIEGIARALCAQQGRDLRQARLDAARSTLDLSWDPIAQDLAQRLRHKLCASLVHA